MSWTLQTIIYDEAYRAAFDLSKHVRNLRLRSVIHGGLQTIQFELVDDYVDAYRWAYDHIGFRLGIFDNAISPPVAEGIIFEPGISEEGNRVTAPGPWQAFMFSQVYNNTASWITAGQTGAQVKHILTTECPGISTDQTNVAEPGTSNFPWQPSDNSYPGDLIEHLASLSDANNAQWYFWLASAPLSASQWQKPIPYFQAESDITTLYTCSRSDMVPGGLNLVPSLRELANDVRVMFTDATGIQNQTASAADAYSQARYGLRERWDYDLGKAPAAAANQYRDLLLAEFKEPQQGASFKLNTWLYDQWGGKWPLWRAIADFPFKITVTDLIPDATVPEHALDNKRTFITLAAEYDYDSNVLTIVPDTEDNRADEMLARYSGLQ